MNFFQKALTSLLIILALGLYNRAEASGCAFNSYEAESLSYWQGLRLYQGFNYFPWLERSQVHFVLRGYPPENHKESDFRKPRFHCERSNFFKGVTANSERKVLMKSLVSPIIDGYDRVNNLPIPFLDNGRWKRFLKMSFDEWRESGLPSRWTLLDEALEPFEKDIQDQSLSAKKLQRVIRRAKFSASNDFAEAFKLDLLIRLRDLFRLGETIEKHFGPYYSINSLLNEYFYRYLFEYRKVKEGRKRYFDVTQFEIEKRLGLIATLFSGAPWSAHLAEANELIYIDPFFIQYPDWMFVHLGGDKKTLAGAHPAQWGRPIGSMAAFFESKWWLDKYWSGNSTRTQLQCLQGVAQKFNEAIKSVSADQLAVAKKIMTLDPNEFHQRIAKLVGKIQPAKDNEIPALLNTIRLLRKTTKQARKIFPTFANDLFVSPYSLSEWIELTKNSAVTIHPEMQSLIVELQLATSRFDQLQELLTEPVVRSAKLHLQQAVMGLYINLEFNLNAPLKHAERELNLLQQQLQFEMDRLNKAKEVLALLVPAPKSDDALEGAFWWHPAYPEVRDLIQPIYNEALETCLSD